MNADKTKPRKVKQSEGLRELMKIAQNPGQELSKEDLRKDAQTLEPVKGKARGKPALLRQAREKMDWRCLPGLQARDDAPPQLSIILMRRIALFVLLPTALMALYLFVIASNQYVVQSQFAVRGNVEPMENTSMGEYGSLIQKHNSQDSFIVRDFIQSKAMVEKAEAALGISKIFSRDDIDFWARYRDPAPLEKLTRYWRTHVNPHIELLSGVIILTVRAFTPEDAVAISKKVIAESEALVNDIARRAQQEAIEFAQRDVDKAEERLKNAYRALQTFRNNWGLIDPIKTAENTFTTIEALKSEKLKAENDLRVLRDSKLDERTRGIQVLVATVGALEFQIKRLKDQLTTDGLAAGAQNNITQALLEYETLKVEQMIAEKLHETARTVLDKARIAATTQHIYLATFEQPALPTYAVYPERWYTLFMSFFIFVVAWSVISLIVSGIKDARL